MRKYFGTDGIRRIANTELTPNLVFKVAKAGAYVLSKCYIGGITTNIEKSKRVPIPSGTIGMCFQDAILDFYHPL